MTKDCRALSCLLMFTLSFAVCLHSSYLRSIRTLPVPLKDWFILSQHWVTLSICVIKSLCQWARVVPAAFSRDVKSHSNSQGTHMIIMSIYFHIYLQDCLYWSPTTAQSSFTRSCSLPTPLLLVIQTPTDDHRGNAGCLQDLLGEWWTPSKRTVYSEIFQAVFRSQENTDFWSCLPLKGEHAILSGNFPFQWLLKEIRFGNCLSLFV